MTISRNRKHRISLVLILFSFLAAHLCFRLLPNVFEMGNAHTNLRILVASADHATAGELYAKMMPGSDLDSRMSSAVTRLPFAWESEEVKQFFANQ